MARPCLTGALARPVMRLASASAFALLFPLATAAHALVPQVSASTPPGWSAPVVPTTTGGFVDTLAITVPATLAGGGATWLHWASSGNVVAVGGWTDRLSLDGDVVETLVRPLDPRYVTHWFRSANQGPTIVRGGRHTLKVEVDIDHVSGESIGSYADDTFEGQWVWSPLALAWGATGFGGVPPVRGALALPNCDGYSLAPPAGTAWSIGLASAGDDDLALYDDYTGATSGFSHALATSAVSAGVEFVVGSAGSAPTTVYPGVLAGTGGAAGSYVLSSSDAATRTGGSTAVWGATLPAYRVTETYVAHLEAGVPVTIGLPRDTVDPALAVAVFAAGAGVQSREQALAVSSATDAMTEGLSFTAPATGDYPLVVFRRDAATLGTPNTYVLELSHSTGTERVATPLALAAPVPNPAHDGARLAFSLVRGARVTLSLIDVQGRRVRTLVAGERPAGAHEVEWDGRDEAGNLLPAGSYWLRLETPDGTRTRPLTLTR